MSDQINDGLLGMTLKSFLKGYSGFSDQYRSQAAYNLFDAYVDANGIKFENEIIKKKCKRFFWLGFEIIARMKRVEAEVPSEI